MVFKPRSVVLHKQRDAIIICASTLPNTCRESDFSFVGGTIEALIPHLRAGQTTSLGITTYSGTTDEEFKQRNEFRGLENGKKFFSHVRHTERNRATVISSWRRCPDFSYWKGKPDCILLLAKLTATIYRSRNERCPWPLCVKTKKPIYAS